MTRSLREIGISSRHYHANKLKCGDPTECTRLLRRVLLQISLEVATQIMPLHSGVVMFSDKKFVNTVFRYLREQSKYFPALSPVQYHHMGFGEHKMFIIDAAARHVLLYLQNGGERVPESHPFMGMAHESSSSNEHNNKNSRKKKKGRCSKLPNSNNIAAVDEHLHVSTDSTKLDESAELTKDCSDDSLIVNSQENVSCNIVDHKKDEEYKQSPYISSFNDDELVSETNVGTTDMPTSIPAAQPHQHQNHEKNAPPVSSTASYQSTEAVLSSLGRLNNMEGSEKHAIVHSFGNIDRELSAIASVRDDLFADSVHSYDSNHITRTDIVQLLENVESRLRSEYKMAIDMLVERVRFLEAKVLYSQTQDEDMLPNNEK